MSAFGGDALQRNAMLHKSSFIIIDNYYGILFYKTRTLVDFYAHKSLQKKGHLLFSLDTDTLYMVDETDP